MPKSRRESGLLALLGVVLVVIGAAVGSDGGATMFYILGVIVFAIGAVLWLIHYSHDLHKEDQRS